MGNKKLQIAVIGAGRWGPNLIRNFEINTKSCVLAVVDTDQVRQKMISEKYPETFVFSNPEAVFSDPKVDAVVICTPTETHYSLTKQALLAGKHVFVEKPLATLGVECVELVRLAKEKNRVLFVGHIFVYNASIQAAAKYIKSGELGKIYYIHMNRTNLGPIRTDVNALWDLAPHDISILQYWLEEMPTHVSAIGSSYINSGVEDVVFATYSFKNKMVANIHVSWLNPKKVREIVVVGEKKMLVWDDMDINSPIRLYDKKVSIDTNHDKLVDSFMAFRASIHEGDTTIPKIKLNEPLAAECEAFLHAIYNPSSSLSTGEHGAGVVEVLEATTKSMQESGNQVKIQYGNKIQSQYHPVELSAEFR